ncbi:MAG: MFS transporter [Planctomycetota bacterium]
MSELEGNHGNGTSPQGVFERIKDFLTAFLDLLRVPRAFWFINVAFMIDSMAYFGILTLMTEYLYRDGGLSDLRAGWVVSFFTGLVTLFMIGIGGLAERLGVRRAVLLAVFFCLVGRVAYAGAPLLESRSLLLMGVLCGLLLSALGEGIFQPVAYAGIKQYTDHKTNAMGYGAIYALMNLGIVFIGWLSPLVRVPVDNILEARAQGRLEPESIWHFLADRVTSGIMGVNWVCVVVTAVALGFYMVFMTKRAEADRIRRPEEKKQAGQGAVEALLPWYTRVAGYFSEGPFSNVRFLFFIFMLLPVQTLFAHQWLTLPPYVLRAYSEGVADRMEWIVNWINPGIIFFGVPIATALTRRVNIYTMMIVGSSVSALPTFLLGTGPHLSMLIVYLVLFSIGEALWQPRFLQYAAELAPEGKVAQYMGLANVPWITAKMTTGLYSGYFLGQYCPERGVQDTGTLWTIYGIIAITSPIGLLLGRKWALRGMRPA